MEDTLLFLDTIINNLPMMVSVIDAKSHKFVLTNKAARAVFGENKEIIGKTLHDLLPKARADALYQRDARIIESGQQVEFDYSYKIDGQEEILFRTMATPIRDRVGSVQYLLSMHEDVTEKRRAQASIDYLVWHDSLTGIGNFESLRAKMREMFGRSDVGAEFALIHIDLDNFKSVNNSFGYFVGDRALMAVAVHLRRAAGDSGHIARLSADRFAIVLEGASNAESAHREIGERLFRFASYPVEVCGHSLILKASIGVAFSSKDAESDTMMRDADVALYFAKKAGGDRCCFFESWMLKELQSRRRFESDLQRALIDEEFILHFQPIVALDDARLLGFEALLRWKSPTRGLVPPAEFIPFAEETGLIGAIGAWVLKQACVEAARWRQDLEIAVNVSAVQFRNRPIAVDVAAALAASGLAPSRLTLEITENVMMQDEVATLETLDELKNIGVKIAIDDFGTGYSSFGYLSRFVFDKVKIDRSFVVGMVDHHECRAIVRAITGLCANLGICTLAEGVETQEQRDLLVAEGCAEGQGFFFGRPASVESVAVMLSQDTAA